MTPLIVYAPVVSMSRALVHDTQFPIGHLSLRFWYLSRLKAPKSINEDWLHVFLFVIPARKKDFLSRLFIIQLMPVVGGLLKQN